MSQSLCKAKQLLDLGYNSHLIHSRSTVYDTHHNKYKKRADFRTRLELICYIKKCIKNSEIDGQQREQCEASDGEWTTNRLMRTKDDARTRRGVREFARTSERIRRHSGVSCGFRTFVLLSLT